MKLPLWFHRFGSPPWVYSFSGACAPWLLVGGLLVIAVGGYWGLVIAPPDYLQDEVYRIIYIHPQTAYIGMMAYTLMAVAAGVGFIWRIKLAHAVAVGAAPIGATFTFGALITGAIWGRPTWGTYWEWGDPRIMFELLLLFLFLGYLALRAAFDDRDRADRVSAILAVVGVVNVPIIHFSVEWWNTLHQPASVLRLDGPTIDGSMLTPLLLMAAAALSFAICLTLWRMGIALTATNDGYVEVPYSALVVPQSGITVEAWITYDDSTLPAGWRYPTVVRQGISVGVERGAASLRLGATLWRGQQGSFAPERTSDVLLDFEQRSLELSPCAGHPLSGVLRVDGCALLAAHQVSTNGASARTIGSLGASARATLTPWRGLRIELEGGLSAALERPRFGVQSEPYLYQPEVLQPGARGSQPNDALLEKEQRLVEIHVIGFELAHYRLQLRYGLVQGFLSRATDACTGSVGLLQPSTRLAHVSSSTLAATRPSDSRSRNGDPTVKSAGRDSTRPSGPCATEYPRSSTRSGLRASSVAWACSSR